MLDRRLSARDRVIYGGVAAIGDSGATRDCVIRNISEHGATVVFRNGLNLPKDRMSLAIAKKGRCFTARVIWTRDNIVGVAFNSEAPAETPSSDLELQLRASEKRKRQLRHQIRLLTGEA